MYAFQCTATNNFTEQFHCRIIHNGYVVGIPTNRTAYVQHQFGHIKQKRRYFVGNTFSRMEVTGIQSYHLITGCAITDVEVIGTYCIAFQTDTEYF